MAAPRAPRAKARAPRAKAPRGAPRAPQAPSPLLDPTAILSGKPLQQAAQQVTDATFKPQFSALDRQAANTQTQYGALSQRGMDYYRQLAQEEARGVAREQALGQMLQGQQSAVGQAAQQAFQGMTAAEQNRQQADAAVRGPGLGGGDDPTAQTIAATQGRAATLQQAAQNTSATQSANWASLMNAIAGAQQLHGQEVGGQILNREANLLGAIGQKRSDLAAQQGDAYTKNLLGLRQQGFTNFATMGGLGLKQSDLQAQAANQEANRQLVAQRLADARSNNRANRQVRQQSITAAGQRQQTSIAAADRRAAARNAAAAQKHSQQVQTASGKAWATVENTLPKMNAQVSLDASGKPTNNPADVVHTRPATTQETLGALRAQKAPEWAIQAALDIRHTGFLSPSTVDLIHRSAPQVRIPRRYLDRRPAVGAGAAGAPH